MTEGRDLTGRQDDQDLFGKADLEIEEYNFVGG